MGARIGLDYASIPVVVKGTGLKLKPALFADLQLMELRYIEEVNS